MPAETIRRWDCRVAVSALAVSLFACTPEEPATGGATEEPPSAAATAEILFADDFSDAESGWTVIPADGGYRSIEYTDGTYTLSVDNDQSNYASIAGYAPGRYENVRIEVSAEKRSGPPTSPIGVRCRRTERDTYFADVDSEGEVRIGAYVSGDQDILIEAERPGLLRDGQNRLRLDCEDDDLVFYVNGERVAEASDGRLTTGQVGLTVGGAGSGVTVAVFDDVLLSPP